MKQFVLENLLSIPVYCKITLRQHPKLTACVFLSFEEPRCENDIWRKVESRQQFFTNFPNATNGVETDISALGGRVNFEGAENDDCIVLRLASLKPATN